METNPLARLYDVNSTPATVLVDPDGRIVARNLLGAELRAAVERLVRP
jgi:thioredoxin-related protein